MKTLDEVIKALEICTSDRGGCEECPYDHDCKPDKKWDEAIHYLKEYQSKQDTIAEQLAELKQKNDHVCELAKTVCEAYDRLCNRLAKEYINDPLTWDELKQMEGKPVWVETLLYKQWAVIGYVGENHIRFEGVNLYAPESRTYMGAENGWQAYRKER